MFYRTLLLALLFTTFSSALGLAQEIDQPKFVVFAGAGTSPYSGNYRGAIQFGASYDQTVFRGRAGSGFLFEGGYVGPWQSFKAGSAIFSANYIGGLTDRRRNRVAFFTGGYTRLFGTGNAINFGGGVDFLLPRSKAIRVELRDYVQFSGRTSHNVGLRVGFVRFIPD